MHKTIKKNVVTALFLALSIVMSYFEITIPGFFKITFEGPFYKFIALIYGPSRGAFVACFAQVFGYLFHPTSGYKPIFTLTAGLRGFVVGLLWKVLKPKSLTEKPNKKKSFRLAILAVCVGLTDIPISIINSFILRCYIPLQDDPFLLFIGTRLTKELLLICVNVLALSTMLDVYQKIINDDLKKEN